MSGDRFFVILWLIVLVSAVTLPALGNGGADLALLAAFVATSSLVAIHLRRRSFNRASRRAFVGFFPGAFVVAFVAERAIGGRTDSLPELLGTLALESLLLAALLSFELRYWRGFERVASLLCAEAAGYATVVDQREAAPQMAAQFARSVRYGEPLTVVVLERDARREQPAMKGFVDALEQAGPGVIDHLSRLFARSQVCALVSERARRSDLVVTDAALRVIVVSGATPQAGAERFAERILRDSEAKLGIALVAGVAACPADGATFDELVARASGRASAGDDVGLLFERADGAQPAEIPNLPLATPLTGTDI
jgi:hypothetical protein